MDDLQARVKALLREIEFVHLKKMWVEQVIEAGIDQADAYKWVAEIGHIVNEYERSLRFLIDLMQKKDKEHIAQSFESWIAYTEDLTVFTIEGAMQRLKGRFEKYLPPEPEDEDE